MSTPSGVGWQGPESDLGPFFSRGGVMRRLGVDECELDSLLSDRRLIGLPGSDGHLVFPEAQFAQDGRGMTVLSGVGPVSGVLAAAGAGPMTIARWFIARDDRLPGGGSVVDWLRAGKGLDLPMALAHADAVRWRR